MIGLGCASGVREEHVTAAVLQGYSLLDTAAAFEWGYREDEVGRALVRSGVGDQVLVQTKVRTRDGADIRAAVGACLERQGRVRADVVLLHKPEDGWREAWTVLEDLYDEGVVRAIGMSDMTEAMLEELIATARIAPMVLQNWMDPFHQDRGTRAFCRAHGIVYQAFSLLGTQWPHLLKSPAGSPNPVRHCSVLARIAAKHGRCLPEIVLRWALAEGVSVIPASTSHEHRQKNLAVMDFELDEDDLASIRLLDGISPEEAMAVFEAVD